MANKLRTPLCDMLGIEHPIVLAGMATGPHRNEAPTPPKLVAAVSNAGGLGVMGYGFQGPDDLDRGIKEVRHMTGGAPFGVDFLLPATMAETGNMTNKEIRAQLQRDYPKHVAFLQDLMRQYDLREVDVPEQLPTSMALAQKQIDVLLDNKVPVFAAALGDPGPFADRLHANGVKIIGMAGAVRHAQRHLAAGVDIVTAQGTEAGGHTGNIATFVLVPQIVDAVTPRPVLAAGGVGSGRHVAAALALGAQGCWVGTAFLASEETNIPQAHQQQILTSASEQFTLSKVGSGKQARSFRNEVKEAWEKSGLPTLPMPLQGVLTEPLFEAARESGRYDLTINYSGQVAGMVTKRRPAKEILMEMVTEAEETIERLQRDLR